MLHYQRTKHQRKREERKPYHKPVYEYAPVPVQREREKPYPPCVPILRGTYRGARIDTVRGRSGDNVHGTVTTTNGWHRGIAYLNGQRIYEGRPTRSRDAAWAYVDQSMKCIRAGLDWLKENG